MGGGGREAKREGTHVYIQLIHVVVQQKLAQHCKQLYSNKKIIIIIACSDKNFSIRKMSDEIVWFPFSDEKGSKLKAVYLRDNIMMIIHLMFTFLPF